MNKTEHPPVLADEDGALTIAYMQGRSDERRAEGQLRAGVRRIVVALRNKEWADLLSTDDDLAALEEEVGKLIGVR